MKLLLMFTLILAGTLPAQIQMTEQSGLALATLVAADGSAELKYFANADASWCVTGASPFTAELVTPAGLTVSGTPGTEHTQCGGDGVFGLLFAPVQPEHGIYTLKLRGAGTETAVIGTMLCAGCTPKVGIGARESFQASETVQVIGAVFEAAASKATFRFLREGSTDPVAVTVDSPSGKWVPISLPPGKLSAGSYTVAVDFEGELNGTPWMRQAVTDFTIR